MPAMLRVLPVTRCPPWPLHPGDSLIVWHPARAGRQPVEERYNWQHIAAGHAERHAILAELQGSA